VIATRNGQAYSSIDDYGVIGDLHTAALVGADGSIDWLCFPRFDSPSVFAAILDRRKGGAFKIAAASGQAITRQLYAPDTNVLITRFQAPDGVGEVHDCMPIMEDRHGKEATVHHVVRSVRSVRATVVFDLECRPAFDYARAEHTVEAIDGGVLFRSNGPDGARLALLGTVPLNIVDGGACVRLVIDEGHIETFELHYLPIGAALPRLASREESAQQIEDTIHYWQRWLRGSTYRGRWREVVNRSALTLKLLTYSPTGAIVASPTMGLPEEVGGERNWDYRYTWLRDAAFTVYALMRIGFVDEAARFMDWLTARFAEAGEQGRLQVLYGIDGRHELPETTLVHLEGYRQSSPVRLGNDAYKQLQLDVYGEVLDAIYLYDKNGAPISYDFWCQVVRLLDGLCDLWREPDEGIWEVRGGRQHFVYSKMMCWVAFDRALRMADKRGLPAPRERWRSTQTIIYQEVMAQGWNPKIGSFVQHYGSDYLDASNLLMPMVKFVSPTDPRMLQTLQLTRDALVSDSLVYRYAHKRAASDGLLGREGTFSMCTFWLVEALARAGEINDARLIFEKMLTYANPLGLFSEEIAPSGEALGNFPQAFSHLALISAAYNLDRFLDQGARHYAPTSERAMYRSG
jgi:GH15 family glucan-1,4-alpha-glucosidase